MGWILPWALAFPPLALLLILAPGLYGAAVQAGVKPTFEGVNCVRTGYFLCDFPVLSL